VSRVSGRVERRELALIFARAAELKADDPAGAGGRLGQRLLEQLLARADEVRQEASSEAGQPLPDRRSAGEEEEAGERKEADASEPTRPARPPSSVDFDLSDLSRSIVDLLERSSVDASDVVGGAGAPPGAAVTSEGPGRAVLSQSQLDMDWGSDPGSLEPPTRPAPRPPDPDADRRHYGRMGLQTLEELFVRGGEVRFDGYIHDLESFLEELYDRFKTVSGDLGITAADIERGNLLGSAPLSLEARRAQRIARKRSGRHQRPSGVGPTSSGRHQALPPRGRQPAASPSGRHPRPSGVGPASSGRHQALSPSGRQPAASPSGRHPRPSVHEEPTQIGWEPRPSPSPAAPEVQGEAYGPRSTWVRQGVVTVRCGCKVERTVDVSGHVPWRVRCRSCGEVLFDPSATLVVGASAEPPEARLEDRFRRWLSGSSELQVLPQGGAEERCALHASQPVVARCRRCARHLCRACLDRVGDAFMCAQCLASSEAPTQPNAAPAPIFPGGSAPAPIFPAGAASPTPAPPAEGGRSEDEEEEPPPPPPPAPKPQLRARDVQRAFERALLLAALEGWIDRRQSESLKATKLIYDHQRRLFKAPLEPRIAAGDRIQLHDGRVFEITAERTFEVDGEPCYRELAWVNLGLLKGPLRRSWEDFPHPAS